MRTVIPHGVMCAFSFSDVSARIELAPDDFLYILNLLYL